VAESAGEVIGTVLASWDGRWAWVSRLAVHSDYRRRGIARLLMAQTEKALTALGAHNICLLVHKEEAAALGLYETLGYTLWEPIGYMSKKLEQPKKEADDESQCC
jgi:ribosomal protein S18 acetylase RimI-like enzyme